MVHVSVGTANALCGAFNAAREYVPILFTAGRSPLTEEGLAGTRDTYIHWAQEMFDQAGMLREMVKWDYELRNGMQLETVIDRALSLATSAPEGPVYLSLPREVLAEPLDGFSFDSPSRRAAAAAPGAGEAAVEAAAEILAEAKRPVIVTASAGRDPGAVAALAAFAERFAIPVVEHRQRHLSLPADHPCHLGYEPTPFVKEADAILVIEADVPWVPSRVQPPADCRVIHLGVDPLCARYPIRGFPCDVAITGLPRLVLPKLGAALNLPEAVLAERRRALAERQAAQRAGWQKLREEVAAQSPIHPAWVSHCLSEVRDPRSILVNEYTLLAEHCPSTASGSYYGSSPAAGLGWGAGAALGVKLAKPDRQVVCILGDGSYIFANPVAVHHADGEAARSNKPPFIDLDDLPAFETVCEAAGGYGERVEDPAALPAAMQRALKAVDSGQQALLNVISRGGAGG
jgi:acetolactate synthase-1/2/3 large subunit